MKILIAEDHLLTAHLLSDYLKQNGYEVVAIVGNGAEAVEFINIMDVEMLILDIGMPVMDGFDTLRALRGKLNRLKVIMFSAYTERWVVEKARELGAHGFVSKRGSLDDLERVISSLSMNFSMNFGRTKQIYQVNSFTL